MAKWVKPGVYMKEVDLSYFPFRNVLEAYFNSFTPKMFYDIQYESLKRVCISVPKVLVNEVRKRVAEDIGDIISDEITIEVRSNGDF